MRECGKMDDRDKFFLYVILCEKAKGWGVCHKWRFFEITDGKQCSLIGNSKTSKT